MRGGVYSVLLLSWLLTSMSVCAEIHRCEGAFGEPSYSDLPCRSATTRVVPKPGPTYLLPGDGLRAGERAWLKARSGRRAALGTAAEGSRGGAARQQAQRQEYRCRQKRRALDAKKKFRASGNTVALVGFVAMLSVAFMARPGPRQR